MDALSGEDRELIEAIFDAVGSQIFVKDLDGRYLIANRQIEIESGVAHDDMIGRTDQEIFPGAQSEEWRANDAAVIAAKEPLRAEETFERDDGVQTFLSIKVPLLDETGEPVALAGVSTNITEQKQLEADLAIASAAKTEFLSRMSHELRTPLNAVIGFAQLLALDDLTEEQRESVGQIRKGGQHLLDLINEVLDIAQIESGKLELSVEPVEARALVAESIDLLAPLASQRGLVLVSTSEQTARPCYVRADRQRLKQVLLNLVSNGLKYTPTPGRVTVGVEPRDATVEILVTDTGAGISPENLQLLFEPFERLGAETTAIEGTGVGLALSKGLVEQMGGSIDVRSEVDRGSTFKVVLASATAPAVAAASPPARSARDASVAPGAPTELVTVLHIEDNLANLRLVERILSRRENISLVSAQTAELGLELAVAQQPALMLLDLHLPDLHGLEVLQRLRRDPRTHEIPVVILSGDATEAQRDRCLEQGAHAYLTKPFDVAGLLAVVDDVVSARR